MTSIGSGEHVFNYPPITVSVKGTIGINTSEPENYHATSKSNRKRFNYIY